MRASMRLVKGYRSVLENTFRQFPFERLWIWKPGKMHSALPAVRKDRCPSLPADNAIALVSAQFPISSLKASKD